MERPLCWICSSSRPTKSLGTPMPRFVYLPLTPLSQHNSESSRPDAIYRYTCPLSRTCHLLQVFSHVFHPRYLRRKVPFGSCHRHPRSRQLFGRSCCRHQVGRWYSTRRRRSRRGPLIFVIIIISELIFPDPLSIPAHGQHRKDHPPRSPGGRQDHTRCQQA